MGREKKTSPEIDGYKYEVTQLGAIDGRKMLEQLTLMALPGLGALLGSPALSKAENLAAGLAGVDVAELDLAAFAQAMVKSTDPNALNAMMDQLAQTTAIYGTGFGDGGAPMSRHFDEHFAARYDAMMKWFGFALWVNFGSFFGAEGSVEELVGKLRSLGRPSASPSTSTGTAGGQ